MGKASSTKKVARAARTGGGRTKRGSSSLGWPIAMALVVVLGTAGIVYSRDQRQPDTSAPRIGDHWHGALGFDICGAFAANLPEPPDAMSGPGIHTHGDGLVHIEPSSARATGSNARLGVLLDAIQGLDVSSGEIDLPDQDPKRNGMECDGRPAVVRTKIWASPSPTEEGEVYNGDPSDIRLRDNQLITIAFLPDDAEIPRPPSESALPSATETTPSTGVPAEPTPTTTADPSGATTSTPPTTTGETTTTTAG